MTAAIENVATLRQELAAARLQRDQLRHALGRVLDKLTPRAGAGFFMAGVPAATVFEWRTLYDRSGGRAPRGGRKPGAVTDAAVVVGRRTPECTDAIRERLLTAGLTDAAADLVARQPITMPIKLAPGIIISVFEVTT